MLIAFVVSELKETGTIGGYEEMRRVIGIDRITHYVADVVTCIVPGVLPGDTRPLFSVIDTQAALATELRSPTSTRGYV